MSKFFILQFILFFSVFGELNATHIFGADLSYKNISGNTYQVTLVLYGDCSGNPSFSTLYSSIPELSVLNGNTPYADFSMQPYGTPGVEVTPVCVSELSNTTCQGGTIPGIARFEFRTNVTLSGQSANWRFFFAGDFGGSAAAGRSAAISNIIQPAQGSSIMQLEATLNNLTSVGTPNNSAEYTTIPTPFFCINIPQQYNQGAIDADSDILTYSMVPGLDNGSTVAYVSPYTAANPLSTQAGTWSFSGSSGQMNFTPNMVSNNLVVTKVTETRNGVVVGTTMREMVFVIQNNCQNQSPSGVISSSVPGVTPINLSQLSICEGTLSPFPFSIQTSDPDSQNVDVKVSGLPGNMSYTIAGNNTPNPVINFTFTIPSPYVVGDYTFYVTFTDDGCPLSSKQTIAYTIKLVNPFTQANAQVTTESCLPGNDGVINVVVINPAGGLQYSLNGNSFQGSNSFNNLNAGNYMVTVRDANGCKVNIPVELLPSPNPVITTFTVNNVTCNGLKDGKINVIATSPVSYTSTLYPDMITNSSGLFTGLSQGTYTVVVLDSKGCSATSIATIIEPPPVNFTSIQVQNTTCDKDNGKIIATGNLPDGISFFLKPIPGINKEGVFTDLPPNTYTLSVRNEFGCSKDTIVIIGKTINNFTTYTTQTDLPCIGSGNEGIAEVFASGGQPPYTYLWSNRDMPTSGDKQIRNLYYGWYFVTTTDALGCESSDTVHIKSGNCCEQIFAPTAFTPNGDGNNDRWQIISSTGIQISHFYIYNRWGQKIWNTEDQREEWNGKHKDRIVDNGTYYFVLRYTCLTDGKTYMKSGEINVLN